MSGGTSCPPLFLPAGDTERLADLAEEGDVGTKPEEGEEEELSPTETVIKVTRSLLNAVRNRDFNAYK